MMSDEDRAILQKQLGRLDGRVLGFGAWSNLPLEAVPREYLWWCLQAVNISPKLRANIIGVLSRPALRMGRHFVTV